MNTVKKTRKVAGGVTGRKGHWLVPVINEEIEVSTDKFVKYYPVEALKLLKECTGTERVVIDILMSQIEDGSVLTLDSEVKKAIKEILDVTDITVTRIISSLKKKNIIRHYRGTLFMLNPEVAFVGDDVERVQARNVFNSLDPASNMRGHNLAEARKQRRCVKAKEKHGNTEENEGKEESKKSNNEEEEPTGEPKGIVYHPEAEVIAQVQGYNPVTTPNVEVPPAEDTAEQTEDPNQFLENVADVIVAHAPTGIDKNKLGTWLMKDNSNNLKNWFLEKERLHAGADPNKLLEVYCQPDKFSELYTIFKSGGRI